MSAPANTSHAREGRWPAGFVGMLALLLAIESALANHDRGLLPVSAADWRLTGNAATRDATRADFLCFGDSLVKTGVIPAVLEARLGGTTYNLSALGAPPPASYFLLRRALEAGAKPRAIVLDFKPSVLISEYRGFVRDWSELLDLRDALDLAREDGDPGFFGLYLVHRAIPSVRLRLDVRAAVVNELGALKPEPASPWLTILERQRQQNRGAMLHPPSGYRGAPDPFPLGAIPDAERHAFYPDSWEPRATSLNYLKKFLDLASARDLPVFLLLPPIQSSIQAERERRGLDAKYEAIVRKIHARYRNVIVLDNRHAGFGPGLFADSHHLDRDGAAAQTEAIATAMGRYLEGQGDADRWTALRPVSHPDARIAVEDLNESMRTLDAGRVRR